MTRPAVDVRRVGADDLDELVLLWTQARQESGATARALTGHSAEQLRSRLLSTVHAQDVPLLLARWDGRPAGYVVLRIGPLMPVVDHPSIHVETLYVTPDLRRHGVAKALLAGVVAIAERHAADQVVISAPPSSREAQRFLARLGFTPLVVRRIAATAALRRRLAGESRRGGLDDLLARRRSLRARAATTPAGLAPDGTTLAGPAPAGATLARATPAAGIAPAGPPAAREVPVEAAARDGALSRLRVQAILSRRVDSGQENAADTGVPATVPPTPRPHDTLELPVVPAD